MDPEPLEPGKPDQRVKRARRILYIVMAVLTASPFILYALFGSRTAPIK
jgi:hypothetical protein